MLIRVIDIETTGFEPSEGHKVVEIAATHYINGNGPVLSYQSLVNPEREIPVETQAVHHINDEDVAHSVPLEKIAPLYSLNCDYYAAHNAKFEQKYLTEELGFTQPWICTYRVSTHLYPDAPSHSNQALRYYLKDRLYIPRDIGMPHRALPDCIVTGALLMHFLTKTDIEEMLRWSNMPVLQRVCRFGKHAGTPWDELPKDYLWWIVKNGTFDEDIDFTARHHLGIA